MAADATLYKINVKIADMDAGYYDSHRLILARHPSETLERMMVRLLAFVLYASDTLSFGRGLCVEDEPALRQEDAAGRLALWIDVGLPEARAVRKACRRADHVVVLAYGRSADQWWQRQRQDLTKLPNLSVLKIEPQQSEALAQLAQRNLDLTCNIQEGMVCLLSSGRSVIIEPVPLLAAE